MVRQCQDSIYTVLILVLRVVRCLGLSLDDHCLGPGLEGCSVSRSQS